MATSKLRPVMINTESMLAMRFVHEAAIRHFDGRDKPTHRAHPLRECDSYLDALEELMILCFEQGADYK